MREGHFVAQGPHSLLDVWSNFSTSKDTNVLEDGKSVTFDR